jgi:DNA-binding GntR family transcriptional regulator
LAGKASTERRGDLVSRAYGDLRELILQGHYLPGRRLSQKQLADELAIGRTPLREALRLLEADGYVVSTANRGVTVAAAAVANTEELYAIRLLLEPPMVAGLVEEFTDAELREMEDHLGEMERAAQRHRDFQAAHLDFHLVAIERYGEEMARLVLALHRRVFWHQRVYMSRPRVPEDFVSIDRALLDALEARDAAAVRAALEFHLLDAALGLVLDVEPDHRFGPLLVAAHGLGLAIDHLDDGRIERPAVLRREGPPALALSTSNLRAQGATQ